MTEELAKPKKTIREFLHGEEFKSQIALALPRHISPDRFVRISLTAMTRTPKLADCDQASFFMQLMTLSQLGLEPDGRLAHLIPFKNNKKGITECQLIVDYKGLAALAMRSGQISKIHADKVCENDIFEFDIGEVKKHKIDFHADRGEPYAYYALVVFKDGVQKAVCMPRADVDAIRRRSRAANDGPWVTDYDEMAKKTCFRNLSKWLELSPEYRDALEADWDRPPLDIKAEAIPQFDVPAELSKATQEINETLSSDRPKRGPGRPKKEQKSEPEPGIYKAEKEQALAILRMRLLEHNVEEKVFCRALSLIGFEIGDVDSLDELNQTTLVQLVNLPMNKMLDEMEAKANK